MKVLQVTTHMNIGGIGNYILSLSKALKDKGVYVVVASSGGNLEEELKDYGISHKTIDIDTKFEFAPRVLKSIFDLCRIIKDEGIEVIHSHTRVSQVACFFASRITGSPYVTTCHGFFKKRLRGIFDTWGNKVIAISDAVKIHLQGDLGVDNSRIELIYNGVDMEKFSRKCSGDEIQKMKREMRLKDGPVIGNIGRLSPVKGQKFLVRALKDVISKRPDVQGLIIGDGGEELALKSLAKSLGIESSVLFLGSRPDTYKFLSVMDVFVFPSLQEGLGIALLEALAAGRACVASEIGGISDIIKSGFNGILVPVANPSLISDAILQLLNDANLRKEMGKNGSVLVKERFSLSVMADKVFGLYREILESHASK